MSKHQANRHYALLEMLRDPKPPASVADMADRLGCTQPTVWVYLKKLEGEGLVIREGTSHRTVKVTAAGQVFQPEETPINRVKTARRRQRADNFTPKGGTLQSRMDAIYRRAKEEGTLGWAQTAPRG